MFGGEIKNMVSHFAVTSEGKNSVYTKEQLGRILIDMGATILNVILQSLHKLFL